MYVIHEIVTKIRYLHRKNLSAVWHLPLKEVFYTSCFILPKLQFASKYHEISSLTFPSLFMAESYMNFTFKLESHYFLVYTNHFLQFPCFVQGKDGEFSTLKDLPKATKVVFSRLPFVFITLGACSDHFGISASIAFIPKVIETQFYLSPGRASLLFGMTYIPCALLGNLTGKECSFGGRF